MVTIALVEITEVVIETTMWVIEGDLYRKDFAKPMTEAILCLKTVSMTKEISQC